MEFGCLGFCAAITQSTGLELRSNQAAREPSLAGFHSQLTHFAVQVAAVQTELFRCGRHVAAGQIDVPLDVVNLIVPGRFGKRQVE